MTEGLAEQTWHAQRNHHYPSLVIGQCVLTNNGRTGLCWMANLTRPTGQPLGIAARPRATCFFPFPCWSVFLGPSPRSMENHCTKHSWNCKTIWSCMVLQPLHHTTRSQKTNIEKNTFFQSCSIVSWFNHIQPVLFHHAKWVAGQKASGLEYATLQPSCLLYSQPAVPVACKCQRWPAQSVAISSLSWCLLGWCRDPKRTRREGQGPLAVALSPSLGHPIVHLMCLSDFCRTAQHGLWLWHPTHGLTLHCTHWTCDPFTWQNSFPLWPSRAYALSWRSHCHIHHCSWYPG